MALMHREIDSMKSQLIAANATLTDTEATAFWPVYEQYSAELRKITYPKTALIKEYAEEYGSLTSLRTDAIATEKLAEGIRKFNSDARRLEEYALSQLAERVG